MSIAFAVAGLLGTTPLGAQSTAGQSPSPQDAAASGQPVFKLEVIEATPLPGLDLQPSQVPAPVQTAVSDDLDASGALDVSDFLNRRFNGVFVTEIQNNPLQPDLNYRGYTASPLLGTPQGLSIYMDGVRMNQPLGDAVSWDLIPRLAIATTTLMPGSNPLFGLNTLGGALALETKNGRSHPGTAATASFGSDRRRAVEVEHGGSRSSGLDWYTAANLFAADGWRDDSPSRFGQLFGKLGWHRTGADVSLSAGYADTSLNGNGLQEQRLLERDYASAYTKPDETDNRASFANLTMRREWSRTLRFNGNAYFRHIRTHTFNGDINDDALDQSVYQPNAAEQAALAAAGFTGFPSSGESASNTPFPSWRCVANVLRQDEPGETCNGLLNRSDITQNNFGLTGQLTWRDLLRAGHTLTIGAGYDGGRSSLNQTTELGYLNPDRSLTGLGVFADGEHAGEVDGAPYDNRVQLAGRVNTGSLFASDVIALRDAWTISLSARFNRTSISNLDRLNPGGGAGSLDGEHDFSRLNPAAGITFDLTPELNLYAGYSQGSRAPTSIELGCADPNQPCKLPNALAGDPPLNQVVTRTVEAGVRGTGAIVAWNAGFFDAGNADDILFVASEQTGFGYFKNFGRTRRQGIELGVSARKRRIGGGAGYTLLHATFESEETIDGTGNSTNEAGSGLEGTIDIGPGDRMPLVPRHMFKAFANVQITGALSSDVDLVAASGAFARGNENNRHEPDGVYYLGPGSSPAYAVVNVGLRYDIGKRLQLIAQFNNVFDRRYYTAAQLQGTGFTGTGSFVARPFPAVGGEFPVQQSTFYAPGAPAAYWVGTRVRF